MKKLDIIEDLKKLYIFESYNVNGIDKFLMKQNKIFLNLLYEIESNIQYFMNPHIKEISMELNEEWCPRMHDITLSITIYMELKPKEALDLLDRFDEEYWLDLNCNKILIMVRPI